MWWIGQQLDRGHAEVLEVLERRLGGQPGVGAAQVLADVGVGHGEALDVRLVDDRVRERGPRRPVALPVEGVVDHDRLGHRGGVVLVVGLEVGVLVAVGDVGQDVGVVLPVDGALDRLGVGVDQQLVGVEAVALVGRVGPVHAVAVALSGADPGQVAVPVSARRAGHLDPRLLAVVVEQAQLHALGVLGEDREVGAVAVPGRAERERPAGPDFGHRIRAPDIGGSLRYPSAQVRLRRRWPSSIVAPPQGSSRGPVPKLQASSNRPRRTRSQRARSSILDRPRLAPARSRRRAASRSR